MFQSPSAATLSDLGAELQKQGGEIRLEWLPSGAVAPVFDLAEAVAKGTLDCALVPTDHLSRIAPSFKAFDKPFAFDSMEDVLAFQYTDGNQRFEAELGKSGLGFLGVIGGEFLMLASKRAYANPDALKGAKFAADRERSAGKGVEAYGATISYFRPDELFNAVNSGAAEGLLAPVSQLREWDVPSANVLPLKHSFLGQVLILNLGKYQALPERTRSALVRAAQVVQDHSYRATSDAPFNASLEDVMGKGAIATPLSPESRSEFVRRSDRWGSSAPASSRELYALIPPQPILGKSKDVSSATRALRNMNLHLPSSQEERGKLDKLATDLEAATLSLEKGVDKLPTAQLAIADAYVQRATAKIGTVVSDNAAFRKVKPETLSGLQEDVRKAKEIADASRAADGAIPQAELTVSVVGSVPTEGVQIYVIPAIYLEGGPSRSEILRALMKFSMPLRDPPVSRKYQLSQLRLWVGPPLAWTSMSDLVFQRSLINNVHPVDLKAGSANQVRETFQLPREFVKP